MNILAPLAEPVRMWRRRNADRRRTPADRVRALVATIEADPGAWDQRQFVGRNHNTGRKTYCAASLVVRNAGYPLEYARMRDGISEMAADLLGLGEGPDRWHARGRLFGCTQYDLTEYKKLLTRYTGVSFDTEPVDAHD